MSISSSEPQFRAVEWNVDYSPETGVTGVCPHCDNDDVQYCCNPLRMRCRFECECGAVSEWEP